MTSEPIADVPFGDLVEFAIGGGWGSEEDGEVPVTIIRGTDFAAAKHGELARCPHRFETKKRAERRTVQTGDILLEISGGSKTSGQTTGRSLLVTDDIATNDGCVVIPASFCRLIRLDDQIAYPRYIYYHLQEMYLSGRAGRYENQSTGISNFQFKYFLANEQVRLPALVEQQRIALALGALDDKIESNRRLGKILEELATALFRARFVDFVGQANLVESEIGPIPEGWRVAPLEDVLTEIEVGTRPRGGVSKYKTGVPSIGAESIVGLGQFDYAKTKYVPPEFFTSMKRGHVKDRDVLLYKDGGRPGEFEPHVTLFGDDFPFDEFAINEHVYRLRAKQELGQAWLYFALSSSRVMNEMRIKGTGVAIPGLNSTQVRSLTILVPPNSEVQAFNGTAELLLTQLLGLCRQNQHLAAIRDALLPRLISGEIHLSPGAV
jgi:type I restriction enzyme S subunit